MRTRAGVVAIVLIFIAAGWIGVDFGVHWDNHLIVSSWRATLDEGRYRSPSQYPGLYYDLSLPALAVAAITGPDTKDLREYVVGMPFRLAVRRYFVVVISLAIVFTFLLVRCLRGDNISALVAAAVVGTSWQLSYHSRFIAPDALLAVFVPMATWLSIEALRRPARATLLMLCAAAMAGLATAAKYPGGLALTPVVWVALRAEPGVRRCARRLLRALLVCVVSSVTFLVTSPQVWLDFRRVFDSAMRMMNQYETGHLGHTVNRGFDHALLMARYMIELLSPIQPAALLLALLAAIGIVRLVRERREESWLFAMVPLLYLLYFTTLRAMIVRNLMVVLPYCAALVGIGAGAAWTSLRRPFARTALGVLLAAVFASNALSILRAADSVRGYEVADSIARLARDIESRGDERFLVSGEIARAFREGSAAPASGNWTVLNVRFGAELDANVAVLAHEYPVAFYPWPANVRGRYRDFGPREIDWDYYPGWWAQDRAVLMSADVWHQVHER